MKKTLSLLLFVVLAWPPLVFGELTYEERSLQGIDSFRVEVPVDAEDNAQNNISIAPGFNSQNFKNAIELRLRSLGIQVDDSLDVPVFIVGVNAMQVGDLPLYPFSIVALFVQEAFVLGGEDAMPFETYAATWDENNIGYMGRTDGVINVNVVKDGILRTVDSFANDYLKANPLEPRSGQGDE